ncbi:MAG: patatin-like phospholipase family protein [Bryobacteraceae bacterium]
MGDTAEEAGNGRGGWMATLRRWSRSGLTRSPSPPSIGLALGGGFARGIAHVGVLRVLERAQIPIHFLSGVSAGSMVAAAYASGATTEEIHRVGASMRFADVARWSLSRLGLAGSERMEQFLQRLLKQHRFEDMRIPLAVVATDLGTGAPVIFRGPGEVALAIRASCSYPGLFQPIRHEGRLLVDGAMSMEIPAAPLRRMGARRVISVNLPMQGLALPPNNVFQVVNRCFQIMQARTEDSWRRQSDLVISPDVCGVEWDSFRSAEKLIEAGEKAATEALPAIRAWLQPDSSRAPLLKPEPSFDQLSP